MKTIVKSLAVIASLCSGPASAAVVFNPQNGHYYEYVDGAYTFDQAMQGAAASTLNHMQGYLVTITSADESNFIYTNVTDDSAWASGSDRDQEAVWKWLAGPEAGQVYWANGSTVTYSNWANGEPNDWTGEDYLAINWFGNQWNDMTNSTTRNYIIEYSANYPVPEPSTWTMMFAGMLMVGATARHRRPAGRARIAPSLG